IRSLRWSSRCASPCQQGPKSQSAGGYKRNPSSRGPIPSANEVNLHAIHPSFNWNQHLTRVCACRLHHAPVDFHLPRRIAKQAQRQLVRRRHFRRKHLRLSLPARDANRRMRRTGADYVARFFVDGSRVGPRRRVLVGPLVADAVPHVVPHLAEVGGIIPPWRLDAMPRHQNHQNRDPADRGTPPPAPHSHRHEKSEDHAKAQQPSPWNDASTGRGDMSPSRSELSSVVSSTADSIVSQLEPFWIEITPNLRD